MRAYESKNIKKIIELMTEEKDLRKLCKLYHEAVTELSAFYMFLIDNICKDDTNHDKEYDMDYIDIALEIKKIQSSIRSLQKLVRENYEDHVLNRNEIIYAAAISCSDNACECLEQTNVLCGILFDHAKEGE